MTDVDNGYDGQDSAETMDDDVIGRDGEFRTFEELPDVLDVTQAEGDADDEEIIELEQDEDPGDGRDVDDERPEVFDGE